MATSRDIATRHLAAALDEAASHKIDTDSLARAFLSVVIGVWKKERSVDDISSELEFTIENLDDDQAFNFMRP